MDDGMECIDCGVPLADPRRHRCLTCSSLRRAGEPDGDPVADERREEEARQTLLEWLADKQDRHRAREDEEH